MLLLLLTLVLSLAASQDQNHVVRPIVTTPLGKILGKHKMSFGNKIFSAFEGIPYAKPPIGARRFEAPVPIEAWSGIWETTFVYECPQVTGKNESSKILGNEDCLYMNIYVPRDKPSPKYKLDVIVHIHGGAFMAVSGHEYAHPEYLMDRDIIFVTFNYRLGILGFLSTGDDVVPGNNGLKDQVLALKWIRDSIANFGGNPESVTLTGVSAGGAAVHLHYLSPMSKGLFQRGFSQSGCALNPWVIQRNASHTAKALGRSVGCADGSTRALVECLKKRTTNQILDKVGLFYVYKNFPFTLFGPVVEKGSEPFLSEEPYQLLVKGKVQALPWIASTVPHEAEDLASVFINDIETLNKQWEKIAPVILLHNCTISEKSCNNFPKKIKEFYLGTNQSFNYGNFGKFVKMLTDRVAVDGTIKAISLQTAATNASVYYYQSSYTGEYKSTVSHCDDLKYFFPETGRTPSENELKMKDIMVNMLVSYAKTSKPTIEGIDWKCTTPNQFNFVNISGFQLKDIKLETDKTLGSGNFWDSYLFENN